MLDTQQLELAAGSLDFLWIELTNKCNLACSHCYAESGPTAGTDDALSYEKIVELLDEAFCIGCRDVQFIGGEPTNYNRLSELLHVAKTKGFERVEVFSNLYRLPDPVLAAIVETKSSVGTSVYGPTPEIHDAVTLRHGSFERTLANIDSLISVGTVVRAGFIEMDINRGLFEQTREILLALGVHNVGSDRLREFGRGKGDGSEPQLSELCGSCAGKTLCVGSDGKLSPCIMSKAWPVGSLKTGSMADALNGIELRRLRQAIDEATREERARWIAQCDPSKPCFPCAPEASCAPCPPNTNCAPNKCRPYCMPN